MTKYYCTVIFDASSTVVVEADTPEAAAEIAEDETSGNQYLCHQCSNTLETGDSIGVHVHNEECTEQLLDTTYRPPQQRKPLTDEQIDKAMAENKQTLIDAADNYWKMRRAYARIIEAAHGIKE